MKGIALSKDRVEELISTGTVTKRFKFKTNWKDIRLVSGSIHRWNKNTQSFVSAGIKCNFPVGTKAFVKETWRMEGLEFKYKHSATEHAQILMSWKSAQHMPQEASRFTVESVNVSIESGYFVVKFKRILT